MSEATVPQSKYPEALGAWKYKDRTLWYSGDLSLLDCPMASVIGSRDISKSGAVRAERITKILVSQGYCVVSGLAKGIDTIAHVTALRSNGKTIAVMGTPIDECYPKENEKLKEAISSKGLVLSQFEPGERVFQSNFPKRNSLMAALAEITIVVEAGEKSGTRHQVQSAISMGRRVGFLASMAEKKYSWVVSALASGKGFLIKEPEDLLHVLARRNEIAHGHTQASEKEVEQLSLPLEMPFEEAAMSSLGANSSGELPNESEVALSEKVQLEFPIPKQKQKSRLPKMLRGPIKCFQNSIQMILPFKNK